MKPKTLYFDYAAATPLDTQVLQAMRPFEEDEFANPSALYMAARGPRQALIQAHQTIATTLGAKPSEIILTAGATESINLAIQGVLRAHPGAAMVVGALEHSAVLATARAMTDEGRELRVVSPSGGTMRAEEIAAAVTDDTVLISLALASSETGLIQPVAGVGRAVAAIRADRKQRGVERPLYLHTDATAAAGWLVLQVERLSVDLLTLNGSKVYGPKQSGCLYVRTGTRLRPLIFGGGQEGGRRGGTENPAAAVGLAMAVKLAEDRRVTETHRVRALRDELEQLILKSVPGAHVVTTKAERLSCISSLWFEAVGGEDLVLHLDREGIAAGTGAACAAGNGQPSEALLALGLSRDEAQGSLRLSLGRQTTAADIKSLATALAATVSRLRQIGGVK